MCLGLSCDQGVRDVVPTLFRGRYFYETKCLVILCSLTYMAFIPSCLVCKESTMEMCGAEVFCVVLQSCGQLSEGSGRATNFYELDAQVKGMPTLEASLVGQRFCPIKERCLWVADCNSPVIGTMGG